MIPLDMPNELSRFTFEPTSKCEPIDDFDHSDLGTLQKISKDGRVKRPMKWVKVRNYKVCLINSTLPLFQLLVYI